MKKISNNKSKKIDNAKLTLYVEKAQQGDREATENIIKETSDYIYYYCLMMLKNPEDSLDAVQDILVVMMEKMNSLKDPRSFLGWLKKIIANYCTNKVTRNKKIVLSSSEEEAVFEDLEDFDQQQIPEEKLDNDETRKMIQSLVESLPESQRECILMYYYQEMSVAEIADAIGVSQGTIKSRLNYGRKAIKNGVLGYEKKGVKLYGLGVLPFLTYFLTTSAESVADSINVDTVLSSEKSVDVLSRVVLDSRLFENTASVVSHPAFSDTMSSLTSKVAVGAMMVAIIVSTSVAGRIFADEEKNGAYRDNHKSTTVATTTATPDTPYKNRINGYIPVKINGRNEYSVNIATPDTAVREEIKNSSAFTETLVRETLVPTEEITLAENQQLTE